MNRLNKSLKEDISLAGGSLGELDDLEELRLLLNSLMKKEVLQSLVEIRDMLNKEPRYAEMYSWFLRNSLDGKDCKFARNALKHFKSARLDKIKPLLKKCLKSLEDLS